jgi:hypothetical protein
MKATTHQKPKGKMRKPSAVPTASATSVEQKSEIRNQKCKTVLLVVSGMSPAIITETVWAMAQGTPPIIPDEVFVITCQGWVEGLTR